MSGIAGIFHVALPKPVDPARVGAMAAALAHRGPDGSGVWTGPGVGLGHRRLATVDLEGGGQPMVSADGRIALVHDGEIYNVREVRAELARLGHAFHTDCDSEVVIAAWRQWGVDCLSRFDGRFAFALYDSAGDQLFLARDRLGEKPLHLAELPDGALIFASELKGLLAHPLLRRNPSPQAIEDYFALGYVPDDACLVEGVRKLGAGHYLLVRRGRSVPPPVRWWDVDFSSPVKLKTAELGDQLIDHLRRSVRSRMVADVPLGAFLSGGVDSSAVVAFMAEASRGAVETCSIGFEEADQDETRYARLVAERFATRHRSRTVAADDFGLIDTLTGAFDEPFADPSALAAYRLCELARETMKVALAGDGADEVFAGHLRYRLFNAEERVRRLIPASARGLLGMAGALYPKLDWAPRSLRAKPGLQALGRSSEEAYADSVGMTPFAMRTRIYGADFPKLLHGHRAEDRTILAMRDAPAVDALSRAQYADLKIRLPGDILTRSDRTSMALGLEMREPFLDHRLIEFAARVPAKLRIRSGAGKWLMRQALGRFLPDEIVRRREHGLVAPIGAWFRGPLAGAAAAAARSPALAELGWFDSVAIARLAEDHRSGRAEHGRLLWQVLVLEKSLQRLFGLGAPSSSSYRAASK